MRAADVPVAMSVSRLLEVAEMMLVKGWMRLSLHLDGLLLA